MKNSDGFDSTDNIADYFSKLLSSVFLAGFENSLHNSFGDIPNLKNKMSNAPLYLGVEFDNYIIHITEENNKLIAKYDGKGQKYLCRKSQQHDHTEIECDQIIFYYADQYRFLKNIQAYCENIYENSLVSIREKIKDIYYLPASRSGLYRALNAFGLILVELTRKRNSLNEKIVLPSISEQDSDYFSNINEINTSNRNQKFNSIAKTIEEKLLKGKVSFDRTTKQILFHPNNSSVDLELLGTSSMIAEVSPIVLYLRYIITSEDINERRKPNPAVPVIFIEEPEAHLHPEAQIVLMECFADLVKMGAKLIITSHSNYMFQKLNNLIAEKKIDKTVINGIIFSHGEKGSRSETIPMSDIGMEDYNFVEVAECLYNEKIQIIEKMEADDAKQNQNQ